MRNPNCTPEFQRLLWRGVAIRGLDECWPWTRCLTEKGYGKMRGIRVHRAIYSWTHDDLLPTELVRHSCNNPACCNPTHLVSGSAWDNSQDMIQSGRSLIGERQPRSKLTESQVELILKDPRKQGKIAKEYGVSRSHISNIKSGKGWKHAKSKL